MLGVEDMQAARHRATGPGRVAVPGHRAVPRLRRVHGSLSVWGDLDFGQNPGKVAKSSQGGNPRPKPAGGGNARRGRARLRSRKRWRLPSTQMIYGCFPLDKSAIPCKIHPLTIHMDGIKEKIWLIQRKSRST